VIIYQICDLNIFKSVSEKVSILDYNVKIYSNSKMCITKFRTAEKCKMMNRNGLSRSVRQVLTQAKNESRLICGLLPAISALTNKPEDALICLLPEARPGDSGTHMQTVLLQAFCYENSIPVIKVDCSEKLGELCGLFSPRNKKMKPVRKIDCNCVLITRDLTIPWDNSLDPPLTKDEQELADFYNCSFQGVPMHIIELPR